MVTLTVERDKSFKCDGTHNCHGKTYMGICAVITEYGCEKCPAYQVSGIRVLDLKVSPRLSAFATNAKLYKDKKV